DDPRALRARPVRARGDEIEMARNRDLADQVREKDRGAFENANEEPRLAVVIGADLPAEIRDPSPKLVLADQHFGDIVLQPHSARVLRVSPGASARVIEGIIVWALERVKQVYGTRTVAWCCAPIPDSTDF